MSFKRKFIVFLAIISNELLFVCWKKNDSRALPDFSTVYSASELQQELLLPE